MSNQKKLYVFMGPPGSGKGSLSALCVEELGWVQVSAGNLCRQEIARGSELGAQIDFALKSGKLVPDGLIVRMVENSLLEHFETAESIILDGFPRTVAQAQELDRLLKKDAFSGMSLSVMRMCITDAMVVVRLTSRLVCPTDTCQAVYSTVDSSLASRQAMVCDHCSAALIRRKDDEEHIIRERLTHYYAHERALVDYFKRRDYPFNELSVEQPLAEIFKQFKYVVGAR